MLYIGCAGATTTRIVGRSTPISAAKYTDMDSPALSGTLWRARGSARLVALAPDAPASLSLLLALEWWLSKDLRVNVAPSRLPRLCSARRGRGGVERGVSSFYCPERSRAATDNERALATWCLTKTLHRIAQPHANYGGTVAGVQAGTTFCKTPQTLCVKGDSVNCIGLHIHAFVRNVSRL